MAWNRELTGDPVVGFEALRWSVPAVRSATQRLAAALSPSDLSPSDLSPSDLSPSDRMAALAAISDAVWTVTIVDAAMVRYHPDVYERVLGATRPADRRCIEQGLAGLRFVRNEMHDDALPAEFVEPDDAGRGAGGVGVLGWRWRPVSKPVWDPPGSRARAWEKSRYRAYRTQLAGHAVDEVFERTVAFLHRAAAEAKVITEAGA